VDRRRDGNSLRRAAQHDIPAQRDPAEPPHSHRRTCETHDLRRVRLLFGIFGLSLLVRLLKNSPHSENRATGVAFALNPLFHPADAPIETRTVRATKLVVLSAGSLGTPAILERSGIGAKGVLEGVGVKQRVDLPGVGENYQGTHPEQAKGLFLMIPPTRPDHGG
jgi:hypothetical protein